MEKRAILAVVLSVLVFVAFFWVQEHYFTPPPAPPSPVARPTPAPVAPAAAPRPPAAAPAPPAPAPPRLPTAERTVTVDGPLYHALVSSDGGKLKQWVLRYRGEKPLVVLGESAPAGLTIGDAAGARSPVAFAMPAEGLGLGDKERSGDLVLTGEEGGLRIRETQHFMAASYAIERRIRIESTSGQPRTPTVALPWIAHKRGKTTEAQFPGQLPTEVLWAETSGHIDRIEDLGKVGNHAVDGTWIGVGSTWYLAAFIPKSPGFKLVASTETLPPPGGKGDPDIRTTIAVQATPTIAPGQAWEATVIMFAGPKEYDRLAAYGLEGALNFGGFPIPRAYGGLPMEWLGVPILRLLQWVYSYVHNYGIAIILLTIVSKTLFYPLTVKSIRSMKAMQALQPQVNALRSKHKSEPQRLQKETLALYKQHKVNPMGGCLPMFAQVPVFYALYLALSVSVELQNAPFLCFGRIVGMDVWICDLANQDPTYVLPVLMGITMFVQQKMTPVAGDPRQAKMMLFMPVVFTFMFFNLPSGLVLYWTVSNILQILQQWFMNRGGRP
ncbi:MAG: membrane protein insertase YidC [Candidatus Rokubacteria bacterium]|nr:membrane protein insertase YidC [Candidatus Rokubacteria bacterium]MBI3826839.1 membrane protein insertase YidC [Candidatus Rokubacteria bacterium]